MIDLDTWARRARGTHTISSRLDRVARLHRVAQRCLNTRRHYAVTVRAWRAIEAHEQALTAQLVTGIVHADTWWRRFPRYDISWSAQIGGLALTSRGSGVSELTSDETSRVWLRRVVTRVTRELALL
jgi:hypothetical protein